MSLASSYVKDVIHRARSSSEKREKRDFSRINLSPRPTHEEINGVETEGINLRTSLSKQVMPFERAVSSNDAHAPRIDLTNGENLPEPMEELNPRKT